MLLPPSLSNHVQTMTFFFFYKCQKKLEGDNVSINFQILQHGLSGGLALIADICDWKWKLTGENLPSPSVATNLKVFALDISGYASLDRPSKFLHSIDWNVSREKCLELLCRWGHLYLSTKTLVTSSSHFATYVVSSHKSCYLRYREVTWSSSLTLEISSANIYIFT